MEKPKRPQEGASATEIQEYLDAYEAWCQIQGVNKIDKKEETDTDS